MMKVKVVQLESPQTELIYEYTSNFARLSFITSMCYKESSLSQKKSQASLSIRPSFLITVKRAFLNNTSAKASPSLSRSVGLDPLLGSAFPYFMSIPPIEINDEGRIDHL